MATMPEAALWAALLRAGPDGAPITDLMAVRHGPKPGLLPAARARVRRARCRPRAGPGEPYGPMTPLVR